MEEAGFIKDDVVRYVVIPLMGVKHTVTLAISTPSDKDNYFATLFNMTFPDTGERVFKCIPIGLACEDCRKRNITVKCMHMIYNLPSWKDLNGHELQVRMLSEDAARQETFAEQLSARRPCFPHYLIDELWNRGHKHVTGRDGTIFIGVDPSRGGIGRSSTAIVAILYDRHNHAVVSHTHTLSLFLSVVEIAHINHGMSESAISGDMRPWDGGSCGLCGHCRGQCGCGGCGLRAFGSASIREHLASADTECSAGLEGIELQVQQQIEAIPRTSERSLFDLSCEGRDSGCGHEDRKQFGQSQRRIGEVCFVDPHVFIGHGRGAFMFHWHAGRADEIPEVIRVVV